MMISNQDYRKMASEGVLVIKGLSALEEIVEAKTKTISMFIPDWIMVVISTDNGDKYIFLDEDKIKLELDGPTKIKINIVSLYKTYIDVVPRARLTPRPITTKFIK